MRVYAMIGLLLLTIWALMGCGQRGLSVDEYHDQVIRMLKSDPSQPEVASEDSGFASMVSLLLSDLDCMGQACTLPLRFEHLRDLAREDRPQLSDYRGQLCDKTFQPPAQEKDTHQKICTELLRIFQEVGAIETTSDIALRFFSNTPGEPLESAVQIALEGAAANLARSQHNIREALASLQQIAWLKPALPSLP